MNNQQVPKADSKFQKIVRKNYKKWKIRLLSHGGQKADSGGGPYKEKPDYKMGKSAPDMLGEEQLDEVIRKKGGEYCLFSKKTKRNLGCYPTKAGAMKRERQVQYFKHLKENIIREELEKVLLEQGALDTLKNLASAGFEKAKSALGVSDDEEDIQAKSEEEKKKAEQEKTNKEKDLQEKIALIYGHSQAGGMGIDLEKKLKSVGYKVVRKFINGANDKKLIINIDSIGDLSIFEKVFLYAGGNSSKPSVSDLNTLIEKFGPQRTTVILPPINLATDNPEYSESKSQKNRDGIKSAFGGTVKVYIPVGSEKEFSKDGIHLRAGSESSIKIANTIVSEMSSRVSGPKSILDDIKNSITSSEMFKAVKDFFASKNQKNLDTSEGLMKFKAHLNNNQDKIADLIYNEFVANELSPNIALAAIINAYKESGLNPNAVGDNGHSVGLFQLHDRGGGSGMSKEDRQDPLINTRKIIKIVKGNFGRKLIAADKQGKSVPILAAIFSRDIERPADKEGNMISRSSLAANWLDMDKSLDRSNIDDIDSIAESKKKGKDDRCVRIAKRKYKAWPSAYASGAVVKCRQGKIWKDVKE